MKKNLILLAVLIIGALIISQWTPTEPEIEPDVEGSLEPTFLFSSADQLLGAEVARPSEYKAFLSEQKTTGHADTTLKVDTITLRDGTTLDADTLGSIIVLGINPGGTNAEIVKCTGLTTATKTFTGCTFGYLFDGTNATDADNIEPHAPGEPVIITNHDLYLNLVYPQKNASSTITGEWNIIGTMNFATVPTTSDECTEQDEFCSKDYIDNTVNQGAATSTEAVGGIVELGTALEVASSTDAGANQPLVLQAKNATSTPGSTCYSTLSSSAGALCTVIATLSGKISQLWLDLTAAFTWAGAHIFNSTVTFNDDVTMENATSTASLHINEICDTLNNCETILRDKQFIDTTNIARANSTEVMPLFATTTIQGGLLGTNNAIHSKTNLANFRSANVHDITWVLKYGGQTLCTFTRAAVAPHVYGDAEAWIIGDGSTSAQRCILRVFATENGTNGTALSQYFGSVNGVGTVDSTTAQEFVVTAKYTAVTGAGDSIAASSTVIMIVK